MTNHHPRLGPSPPASAVVVIMLSSFLLASNVTPATSALVAGGGGGDGGTGDDEIAKILPPRTATANDASSFTRLRFLAVGDWGGQSTPPYYTEGQSETARGMARVASASTPVASAYDDGDASDILERGEDDDDDDDDDDIRRPAASFVLALGDNFYWSGINDDDDYEKEEGYSQMRYDETFDKVYSHPNLQVPWYVIGGNHDYCGDVTEQMKLSDANVRWNYPDYNHKIVREFPVDDGEHSTSVKIEIIMIDTIQLAGTNPCPAPTSEGGEFLSDGYYFELPPDPWNDDAALIRSRETLEWIEESLVGSDADYLLVAGHYGIYSACSHGNNPTLIRELDPLLRKHGVTAYLSGHDHCQFHFAHEGMNYILSGAGDYCCYGSENERHLPKGGEMLYLLADTHDYSGSSGVKGGFLSFDVGHDEMVVSIHRENGDTLHESILSPRGNTFRRKDGNVAVEEE